jgi:hypothetical protein
LYIAPKAWEARTKHRFDHETKVSFETFSNEPGWRTEVG